MAAVCYKDNNEDIYISDPTNGEDEPSTFATGLPLKELMNGI